MIIIEGIDGTGKSTISKYLENKGFYTHHFMYDEKNLEIDKKYLNLLNKDTSNMVLDRCFISELVYGPVIRKNCKLNIKQLNAIVAGYQMINPTIMYLKANKEDLLYRRIEDKKDYEMLLENYENLNKRYDYVMKILGKKFKILEINTSTLEKEKVYSFLDNSNLFIGRNNGDSFCR